MERKIELNQQDLDVIIFALNFVGKKAIESDYSLLVEKGDLLNTLEKFEL